MTEVPFAWSKLVANSAFLRFVDINLRGSGQVIFQNNPLTGLFFLGAITWGAVKSNALEIAVGALVALLIATITAILLDADEGSLNQGLFGFNGILVGAAVPTFLGNTPAMWLLLVVGAAVSTVVMLALSNVLKTWGAPALTFPFVLTSWFLMLAAYSLGAVKITGMSPPALAQAAASTGIDLKALVSVNIAMIEAWIKGPAQVFLINNWVSGILVVLGLAVSSLWAAGLALAGSAIAVAMSVALGASKGDVLGGLYGFSPVLTAVAVGSVFYQPTTRVLAYTFLATIFTVIVQAALDTAFAPIGIPNFTAAFCFVTWIFLLPKAQLKPHPHAPIENGVFTKATKA